MYYWFCIATITQSSTTHVYIVFISTVPPCTVVKWNGHLEAKGYLQYNCTVQTEHFNNNQVSISVSTKQGNLFLLSHFNLCSNSLLNVLAICSYYCKPVNISLGIIKSIKLIIVHKLRHTAHETSSDSTDTMLWSLIQSFSHSHVQLYMYHLKVKNNFTMKDKWTPEMWDDRIPANILYKFFEYIITVRTIM